MIDKERPNCIIAYSSKTHAKNIEHVLYCVKECVTEEGYNPILLREDKKILH